MVRWWSAVLLAAHSVLAGMAVPAATAAPSVRRPAPVIRPTASVTDGVVVRWADRRAGVDVVATAGRTVETVIADLAADPRVAAVAPNYVRWASRVPTDPLYRRYQQPYLSRVRIPKAWNLALGRGVTIAVLDTGIDFDHPDLARKIVPGWDAVNGDPIAADDNPDGHGTLVAGVAAARSDNAVGVAGVAWRARIMPVKVLGANGSGNDADIVEGIDWAADHGADVINLSLGGPGASAVVDEAVASARAQGAVVVASAGNEGLSEPIWPAAAPGVLAVGATGVDDRRAPFSNYGTWVDLVAPGVGVLSTMAAPGPEEAYGLVDGTSFSAPMVAGAAALMRTRQPDLSVRAISRRLLRTARDLGSPGRDPGTGAGMLDAAAALG